jgi:hypothetical protein
MNDSFTAGANRQIFTSLVSETMTISKINLETTTTAQSGNLAAIQAHENKMLMLKEAYNKHKAGKTVAVTTQHVSTEKKATREAIEKALENFTGRKYVAATGKTDFYNQKTGKFGLKKEIVWRTEESLASSTYRKSTDCTDADLKNSFCAGGIKRYSVGMTRKESSAKITPIHVIREEIRSGAGRKFRNINGTKQVLVASTFVGTADCQDKFDAIDKEIRAKVLEQEKLNKKEPETGKSGVIVKVADNLSADQKERPKSMMKAFGFIAPKVEPKKSNIIASFAAKVAEDMKEKTESDDIWGKVEAWNNNFAKLRENAEKAKSEGNHVLYERINSYLFHVGA